MNSRIVVALDGMTWSVAISFAKRVSNKVWGFKINDLIYNELYQPRILNEYGKIMLDPKLYDIPQTMVNYIKQLSGSGISLITIHASAGPNTLKDAVKISSDYGIKVIAVTALTSFTDQELNAVYGCSRQQLVGRLTRIAVDSGCHGVVCAYPDIELVNSIKPNIFKVCPGFRRQQDDKHDQVHTGTGSGADLVVIGRPITQAADPIKAIDEINVSL